MQMQHDEPQHQVLLSNANFDVYHNLTSVSKRDDHRSNCKSDLALSSGRNNLRQFTDSYRSFGDMASTPLQMRTYEQVQTFQRKNSNSVATINKNSVLHQMG